MKLGCLASSLLGLIALMSGCTDAEDSLADALSEHEWTVISMDGFADERSVGAGVVVFSEDDAGQPFISVSNSCRVGGKSAFEWTAEGFMLVPNAEDSAVDYAVDSAACEPSDGLLSFLTSDGESYAAELMNDSKQVKLVHSRYELTLER